MRNEKGQCMGYQLSGYPSGSVVTGSLIAFVEIPLIPGAKCPAKFFELNSERISRNLLRGASNELSQPKT